MKKTIQVPSGRSPNFPDVILDICLQEKINLVIPIHDDEVIALGDCKEKFSAAGITLFLPSSESLNIIRDKYRLYEYCKERNFPVIESSLQPIEGYPQFIKPR